MPTFKITREVLSLHRSFCIVFGLIISNLEELFIFETELFNSTQFSKFSGLIESSGGLNPRLRVSYSIQVPLTVGLFEQ